MHAHIQTCIDKTQLPAYIHRQMKTYMDIYKHVNIQILHTHMYKNEIGIKNLKGGRRQNT